METYWCQYATDWAEIKARWGLTMTKVGSEIVMDMLGTCENPPDMEVEELDYLGTRVGEHQFEPEGESESSVYQSVRGSGVRRRAEGAGKPGRRSGVPEGDGPVRAGRGQYSM